MNLLEVIGQGLINSFQIFWNGFVNVFVAVLLLLIFLVAGYFIAKLVTKLISEFFKAIRFDDLLQKVGLPEKLGGFTIAGIILMLIELFIVLAFLGMATSIPAVDMGIVTEAIKWIIAYLPVLIQGIIVIVVAIMFANYVANIIKHSKLPLSHAIAFIIELFIGYAALVIAFPLILPNADVGILKTAFEWFIGALAIALGIGVGIAVGLGLKKPIEAAAGKPGILEHILGQVTGTKGRKR